jgi:hypothetical protein
MRKLVAPSLLSLGILLVGCGSTDAATTGTTADAGAAPATDSGTTTTADSGSTPVTTDAGSAPTVDAGSSTTGGATLTGLVKRVATTQPSAGGKGNVYVAVFDNDPVVNRQNARSVGNALVADADMSSATASVRYTITNLPPRSQQYFVIAFLDDNKNAPANAPAPDRGDLVSMDGFSAPKVTLSSATSVTLDLNLTMALPF